MLPHLGAGAGQGIEDAFVLARLLSHPSATAENVEVCIPVHMGERFWLISPVDCASGLL